ncbi:MAG: hypothetical protein ABIO94_01630, partial [Opitutaceae bacterium]
LPETPPKSWLVPALYGRGASVVESDYQHGASEARLTEVFPGAHEIAAAEMSLREIFLALARSFQAKP